MSRTWSELLGDEASPEIDDPEQTGFLARLRDSLGKSRRALTEQLQAAAFDPADEEAWERLEIALIQADVGVPATAELVRRLEGRGDLGDLGVALAEEIGTLLGEPATLTISGRQRRCHDARFTLVVPASLPEARRVRLRGGGIDRVVAIHPRAARSVRVRACGAGSLQLTLSALVPPMATAPGATVRVRSLTVTAR